MMNRDDYIPLSYISQYGYCPRRAALLMIEQCWSENEYTAEGRAEHERVHTSRIEKRDEMVKVYETQLYSDQFKIIGKSDCVEFSRAADGAYIDILDGNYNIYPIEYKHGRVRNEKEYNMQLCAQAICLEEMYGIQINIGAIFYISAHRRIEVLFDETLRKETTEAVLQMLEISKTHKIPTAKYSSKCKKCSLSDICMPKLNTSAKKYMEGVRKLALDKEEDI